MVSYIIVLYLLIHTALQQSRITIQAVSTPSVLQSFAPSHVDFERVSTWGPWWFGCLSLIRKEPGVGRVEGASGCSDRGSVACVYVYIYAL